MVSFWSRALTVTIRQKLEGLLEALYSDETNLINSGILSQSQDQFASLWGFRELIPEAASKEGRVYKYDVSVPVERFKEVTDKIRERLKGAGLLKEGGGGKVTDVLGYGHFGDGVFLSLANDFFVIWGLIWAVCTQETFT